MNRGGRLARWLWCIWGALFSGAPFVLYERDSAALGAVVAPMHLSPFSVSLALLVICGAHLARSQLPQACSDERSIAVPAFGAIGILTLGLTVVLELACAGARDGLLRLSLYQSGPRLLSLTLGLTVVLELACAGARDGLLRLSLYQSGPRLLSVVLQGVSLACWLLFGKAVLRSERAGEVATKSGFKAGACFVYASLVPLALYCLALWGSFSGLTPFVLCGASAALSLLVLARGVRRGFPSHST